MQVATIRCNHPLMGGKPFTCAAILPRDEAGQAASMPRLAIGSADGTVRVLNGFKPESLHAVFGTKGTAGVSAMAVVPIHNRDALVTGAHLPVCLLPYMGGALQLCSREGTRCNEGRTG
jgi:hypothetical protein